MSISKIWLIFDWYSHTNFQIFTTFYRKLRQAFLCTRRIGCVALHPCLRAASCAHTSCAYAHPRLDGPTWRMSSRAIKGPVGKRLMTICSEHVSGRPPGNKGPLRPRLLPFSAPETIRSFLSTYGRRQKQRHSLQAASSGVLFLFPFLSLPSFLSPFLRLSLDSQERFAFPARHATPKSSCFLSTTLLSCSPSLPVPPTHALSYLAVWLSPVIPFVRSPAFSASHCVRGRSPFIVPSRYFEFA